MLQTIRSYLSYRASLKREVDELIATHGADSVDVARALAHRALRDGGDLDRVWQIVGRVERKVKAHRQPDTATRYLEGARRAGRHPWLW